jgi:hypothetical protein
MGAVANIPVVISLNLRDIVSRAQTHRRFLPKRQSHIISIAFPFSLSISAILRAAPAATAQQWSNLVLCLCNPPEIPPQRIPGPPALCPILLVAVPVRYAAIFVLVVHL